MNRIHLNNMLWIRADRRNRTRSISKIRMATLALLLTAGSAWSANYFVDPANGLDENSGLTTNAPWEHAPGDSFAKSNAAALHPKPGDSFVIKGGSLYTNMILTAYSGSPTGLIRYVSGHLISPPWGEGRAVFDGMALTVSNFNSSRRGMITINESKYNCIEGFEIRNIRHDNGDNFGAIAVLRGASSGQSMVKNCLVHNVDTTGILASGMMYARDGVVGDVQIEGCEIYQCRWHGIKSLGAVTNLAIVNNVIHDNGNAPGYGDGIFLGDVGGGAFPSNVVIRGNTIYNHPTKGAIILEPAVKVLIEKNNLWGSNNFGVAINPSGFGIYPSSKQVIIRNNIMNMETYLEGVIRIWGTCASGSVDGVEIYNNTIIRGAGTPYGGVITLEAKNACVITNISIINNVVITRDGVQLPLIFTYNAQSGRGVFSDRNHFYTDGSTNSLFTWQNQNLSLNQWRGLGFDSNSLMQATTVTNGKIMSSGIGQDLSNTGFSDDYDGNSRHSGSWSIGAYERAVRPVPSPPRNARKVSAP